MQNIVCPLCAEIVDTIEDDQTYNSRDHQRPGQHGMSWEVRTADHEAVVRPAQFHACAT